MPDRKYAAARFVEAAGHGPISALHGNFILREGGGQRLVTPNTISPSTHCVAIHLESLQIEQSRCAIAARRINFEAEPFGLISRQ